MATNPTRIQAPITSAILNYSGGLASQESGYVTAEVPGVTGGEHPG